MVGGDLNAPPDSLDIALFQMLLPSLRDAWGELHPDEPGYSSNSPDNSLSKGLGMRVKWFASTALLLQMLPHAHWHAVSKSKCTGNLTHRALTYGTSCRRACADLQATHRFE